MAHSSTRYSRCRRIPGHAATIRSVKRRHRHPRRAGGPGSRAFPAFARQRRGPHFRSRTVRRRTSARHLPSPPLLRRTRSPACTSRPHRTALPARLPTRKTNGCPGFRSRRSTVGQRASKSHPRASNTGLPSASRQVDMSSSACKRAGQRHVMILERLPKVEQVHSHHTSLKLGSFGDLQNSVLVKRNLPHGRCAVTLREPYVDLTRSQISPPAGADRAAVVCSGTDVDVAHAARHPGSAAPHSCAPPPRARSRSSSRRNGPTRSTRCPAPRPPVSMFR